MCVFMRRFRVQKRRAKLADGAAATHHARRRPRRERCIRDALSHARRPRGTPDTGRQRKADPPNWTWTSAAGGREHLRLLRRENRNTQRDPDGNRRHARNRRRCMRTSGNVVDDVTAD